MINPNELREMANEIDRNIELEQEKFKQEKKAREFEKKRMPNKRKVRNELVNNKQGWQYQLSALCLQLANSNLNKG